MNATTTNIVIFNVPNSWICKSTRQREAEFIWLDCTNANLTHALDRVKQIEIAKWACIEGTYVAIRQDDVLFVILDHVLDKEKIAEKISAQYYHNYIIKQINEINARKMIKENQ